MVRADGRLRAIAVAALALLLIALWAGPLVAGPPVVALSVSKSGPGPEITLDWTGGQPDFAVHRASNPASVANPASIRTATNDFTWDEPSTPLTPGNAHYYVVQETDLLAGSYPDAWINGQSCITEPEIQVHAYNSSTFILRQSLCTNFEGPFIFLLFGTEKVLMLDSGAGGIAIADTVYNLIGQSIFDPELVVSHSHAHGDHVAGDSQFQGQPNTTVVGLGSTAVATFFGITDWPEQIVPYDLGDGHIVDIIPIPGHQSAHIALYDRQTGLLFTGDTLYPGRLYISTFSTYRTSIQRLVDFIADKPVVNILGTHIEMTNTPFQDFPFGSTVHRNEHELQLDREHLLELLEGLMGMTGSPQIEPHADFVIYPL